MSTISEQNIAEFLTALHSEPGVLDAWLKRNNEAQVRAVMLSVIPKPASKTFSCNPLSDICILSTKPPIVF